MDADQRRGKQGGRRHAQRLQVVAAADSDQAEKDEHEDFTERAVGDGLRPAGIGPAGKQRGQADDDDGPAAVPDEVDAAQESQRETQPGARLDRTRRQPAFGSGAPGAEAAGRIGAAQVIADIVEQVGADLDEGSAQCGSD